MHIYWHGTTTVKIQAKTAEKDVTILIDPYTHTHASSPRSYATDIALLTRGEKNTVTLAGSPFVTSTPGEYEVQGVLITGIRAPQALHTHFRVDVEQISLAQLALTNTIPTDKELEELSNIDVLLLPVGHKDGFTAAQAASVLSEIEPRIVIPIGYQSVYDTDAAPLSAFLKELGTEATATDKKAIIKKQSLPQDDLHVIICEAQ